MSGSLTSKKESPLAGDFLFWVPLSPIVISKKVGASELTNRHVITHLENNMALVFHPPGSTNYYWRLHVNGKPKQGSCFTSNKSVAARYEAKKRKEFDDQKMFGTKQSLPTHKALAMYLESMEKSGEYDNIVTRVNKLLGTKMNKVREVVDIRGIDGNKPFHALSDADIQRLVLARRKDGSADATILAELTSLNQAIKLVKKLGYAVPEIDFAAIKKDSSVKPSNKRVRFLTVEEEQLLLAQLDPALDINGIGGEDVRAQRQDMYDLVVLGLDTGARYSELATLPLTAINVKKGEIVLYRSKVDNESIIPATERALTVLKRRMSNVRAGQVYLFENKEEDAARNYTTRSFDSAVRRADLNDVTFHTLRHTFASRLAVAGVPLYDISKMLGHSTITMTQRYAHLCPNQSFKNAITVLNQLHR